MANSEPTWLQVRTHSRSTLRPAGKRKLMLSSFVSTSSRSLRSSPLNNLVFNGAHALSLCRRPISISPISRLQRARVPFRRCASNSSSSSNLRDWAVPTFKEELFREKPSFQKFSDSVRPGISRQIAYFLVGSAFAFYCAADFTNIQTEKWQKALSAVSWTFGEVKTDEIKKARYLYFHKRLQDFINGLKNTISSLPLTIQGLVSWLYVGAAQTVLDLPDGRRAAWAICAVNTAIFLVWQIRRFKPMMYARFTHNPLSGKAYTMLTSTFSHQAFIHLLFNSLALSSFGSAAVTYLAQEQKKTPPYYQEATPMWHFFAFFVSAGMFASLVSHIVTARFRFPRLVKELSSHTVESTKPQPATMSRKRFFERKSSSESSFSEKVKGTILPSLGASGAIYACVTMTALAYPTAQVTLVFPPFFPIPISWGVGGMLCLDVFGIIRGWRLFDHWAHLGGAAFGVIYYAYGPQVWGYFRSLARRLDFRRLFREEK